MRKLALKTTARQRAEQKRLNTDTVEKWRALRRIGVYQSKETPAISRLTKSRRAAIEKKFKEVQSLGTYDNGSVYRPLHREQQTKTYTKFDEYGRATKVTKRERVKYELDKEHFAALNKKPKELPSNSLATKKGALVAKEPAQKIRVTKDGKIETTETVGGAVTRFTREPLSGAMEFINLLEDIKTGRLKFASNEGLVLYNNGKKEGTYYGGAVQRLAERLERYVNIRFKGMRNFDDWASNSEIAKVRRL